MKIRQTRLAAIANLLTNNHISCQEELSKQLSQLGYSVTQATLSRDLKKLRTVKVTDDRGSYYYILPQEHHTGSKPKAGIEIRSHRAYHTEILSLRLSRNIIIIKTRNGYAGGVAYDIDTFDSPAILGTISGADTVFAIADENASRSEILDLFENFIPKEVINETRELYGFNHGDSADKDNSDTEGSA